MLPWRVVRWKGAGPVHGSVQPRTPIIRISSSSPGEEPVAANLGTGGDQRANDVCNMFNMSTHSLRDLRSSLGSVVRRVAATGEEAIVTDSGTEVAVVISMTDYERLHEHADVADAIRLRELRSGSFNAMSLAEMLDALDVDADAFARR